MHDFAAPPLIGLVEGLTSLTEDRQRHVGLLFPEADTPYFDFRAGTLNATPDKDGVFGNVVLWEASDEEAVNIAALTTLLRARQTCFRFTNKPVAPSTPELKAGFDAVCDAPCRPDMEMRITCASLAGLVLQRTAIAPPHLEASQLHRTRQVRELTEQLTPRMDDWNVSAHPQTGKPVYSLRSSAWLPFGDLLTKARGITRLEHA